MSIRLFENEILAACLKLGLIPLLDRQYPRPNTRWIASRSLAVGEIRVLFLASSKSQQLTLPTLSTIRLKFQLALAAHLHNIIAPVAGR